MSRLTSHSAIPSSLWKMATFVVVSSVLLGLLAILVGNLRFTDQHRFVAEFTDATGVGKGDRVRLAGVEVGTVTGVTLVEAASGAHAQVSFTVDKTVPVYADVRLALRYENLLGRRYLELQETPGSKPQLADGATVGLDRTTPALNLTTLFNGFQPLFSALDPAEVNRLSGQIVAALQGEGPTYASLMASTAQLTQTLANRDQVIGRVITNLSTVLDTVGTRDQQLTALIRTFRQLMNGYADSRTDWAAQLPGLASLLTVSADTVTQVRGPLRGGISALAQVAALLDRDRGLLADSLARMPLRERDLARTGTYGSMFNFYVCGLSVDVRLMGGTYLLRSPGVAANERDTVCSGKAGQ